MADRSELLRAAYAAHARGDLGPFAALLEPGARWLGVEGSGEDGDTPT